MADRNFQPDFSVSPASQAIGPAVSWSAVAAGWATAMAAQITFYCLALGLGAEPNRTASPTRPGAYAWTILGWSIPGLIGAWMAGRLCDVRRPATGALHGFLAWSAALLTGVLAAPLADPMTTPGDPAAAAWEERPWTASLPPHFPQYRVAMPSAQEEQNQFIYPGEEEPFSPTGRPDRGMPLSLPELARMDPELSEAVARLEWRGGAADSPVDRERVSSLLVEKHGMESSAAETMILEWDKQLVLARAEREHIALESAEKASRAAAKGALFAFFALALGGMIAAGGGWSAAVSAPRTPPRASDPWTDEPPGGVSR